MVWSRNRTFSRKLTIKMSRFLVALFVVACVLAVSATPIKEETTTKAKEHSTSTTTTTEKGHHSTMENHSTTEKTYSTPHMCGETSTTKATTKKPHDELTHKEAFRRLRDTTHDKHPGTTSTTHKPYTPPGHKANVDLLKKDTESVRCHPVHDMKKDGKKDDSHVYNPLEVLKGAKH